MLMTSCASPAFAKGPPLQATEPVTQRFGGSYIVDFCDRKATQVVTYRLKTYTDVFDVRGFDADLSALAGTTGDGAKLGFSATHTWERELHVAKEFKPILGVTLGVWVRYGTDEGKMAGGPFVGGTLRF